MKIFLLSKHRLGTSLLASVDTPHLFLFCMKISPFPSLHVLVGQHLFSQGEREALKEGEGGREGDSQYLRQKSKDPVCLPAAK